MPEEATRSLPRTTARNGLMGTGGAGAGRRVCPGRPQRPYTACWHAGKNGLSTGKIEILRVRARAGDVAALTELGKRLLTGDGTPAEPAEAADCLADAAAAADRRPTRWSRVSPVGGCCGRAISTGRSTACSAQPNLDGCLLGSNYSASRAMPAATGARCAATWISPAGPARRPHGFCPIRRGSVRSRGSRRPPNAIG